MLPGLKIPTHGRRWLWQTRGHVRPRSLGVSGAGLTDLVAHPGEDRATYLRILADALRKQVDYAIHPENRASDLLAQHLGDPAALIGTRGEVRDHWYTGVTKDALLQMLGEDILSRLHITRVKRCPD